MPKLTVSLDKLERYAANQGGYDIFVERNVVILSFVPVFPEVLEKGDESPPRVVMTGELSKGKVEFQKVVIEDGNNTFQRSPEESEMVYKSWLDFIEENY